MPNAGYSRAAKRVALGDAARARSDDTRAERRVKGCGARLWFGWPVYNPSRSHITLEGAALFRV